MHVALTGASVKSYVKNLQLQLQGVSPRPTCKRNGTGQLLAEYQNG